MALSPGLPLSFIHLQEKNACVEKIGETGDGASNTIQIYGTKNSNYIVYSIASAILSL